MMDQELRVVFAGTPDISASILRGVIAQKYNIVGVFTQPDRMKGRGKKSLPSPVKLLALDHNIPVYQPRSFKKDPEMIAELKALKADIMVVVAYGLLLPQLVLDVPKNGCINIHVSLLPKWRGAAPIQRAIEAGDEETGVTIIQMDQGLDTGDILHTVKTDIVINETSQSLHDRLAILSVPAVCHVLDQIKNKKCKPVPQPKNSSYAAKLTKEEGLIDFKLESEQIERKVRAFTPWPGSYFYLDKRLVKVSNIQVIDEATASPEGTILAIDKTGCQIQTKNGAILIGSLQFPGKKMLSVANILNGNDLSHYVGQII